MSDNYLVRAAEIAAFQATAKTHFLNDNAKRQNKSLGDLTGLTGFGFHLIEVEPGCESTEYHVHHYEDECTYVLSGQGHVLIGDTKHAIAEGDFIGYRKKGQPHTMMNTSNENLVCIVVGERLAHDVGDYPKKKKRIYRHADMPANVVDHEHIEEPVLSKK